jgi:hypothetical protein
MQEMQVQVPVDRGLLFVSAVKAQDRMRPEAKCAAGMASFVFKEEAVYVQLNSQRAVGGLS